MDMLSPMNPPSIRLRKIKNPPAPQVGFHCEDRAGGCVESGVEVSEDSASADAIRMDDCKQHFACEINNGDLFFRRQSRVVDEMNKPAHHAFR